MVLSPLSSPLCLCSPIPSPPSLISPLLFSYFVEDTEDSSDSDDGDSGSEEEQETKSGDKTKKGSSKGSGSKDNKENVKKEQVSTGSSISDRAKSRHAGQQEENDRKQEAAEKRGINQVTIKEKKKKQALKRIDRARKGGSSAKEDDKNDAPELQIVAYDRTSAYPREAISTATHVDMEQEVLFLPINGRPVPFHISTIKNVSKQVRRGRRKMPGVRCMCCVVLCDACAV